MSNAAVFSLGEPGEIDPRTVLTGPLSSIRRVRLAPGGMETLSAAGVEFTFFVLAGTGSASTDSARVELATGLSVTVPLHTRLRIAAGSDGLEYFLVELAVPA
jgi:mannose-6-phosphate isomerase-like protein (cupin superfamily)